jgi:2-amino-4-hydroxy-6-hydroxymethyldihydropteridine diphosphokinase
VKPRSIDLPAVLSIGSNLGDRAATLRDAVTELAASPGIRLLAVSDLVETPALKPDGVDHAAPAYLNAAVSIMTTLRPRALLERIHEIEAAHGRVRQERWGDRTLDIDIVTMDGLRIEEEDLVIPHPRAHERAFVLAPWLQIAPDAELPGRGRVDALLAATGDTVEPAGALP